MSIQDLEVPNDYNLFCGSINGLSGGFPGPTGATGPQGATGAQGPSGPTGPNGSGFSNHASARFSSGATPQNFGAGSSPIHVPFDVMDYNPSGTWSLVSGNSTSAVLHYTGTTGKFLVNVSTAYQFNGVGNAYCVSSIITGIAGQQGDSVPNQPMTTGVIGLLSNTAYATVTSGDNLWIQLSSNGTNPGDYVAQPGLGGGNITILQVA